MAGGLDSEVQFLKGVGPRNATALAKIGLTTVRDILYHVPRRYEDRRNIPPIGSLRIGQFATVKGRPSSSPSVSKAARASPNAGRQPTRSVIRPW